MAITLADFTKIWASTSPLTPYSFSESNYKEGWNFIGGTPPSRQMWDSIQKQNDEKLKYIVDNFLPLSGGTMTGDIIFDKSFPHIRGNITTGGMGVFAGDNNFDGATLQLFGRNDSDYAGRFYLRASTKSSPSDTSHPIVDLVGNPNGSLTWDNKEIERVNSSGSNYIRYESGLQICWGEFSVTGGTAHSSATCTLPVSFVNTSYTITVCGSWVASTNEYFRVESKGTTKFIYSIITPSSNTHAWYWCAVGWWK